MLDDDVFLGNLDEPTPLLPLMALVTSLSKVEDLVSECNITEETHEDRSRWLEAKLIEDPFYDEMIPQAFVEWAPDWNLGETARASVLSWTMRVNITLLLVRWDEHFPHWWSYGSVPSDSDWFEELVKSLEYEVGRVCCRAVNMYPRCGSRLP